MVFCDVHANLAALEAMFEAEKTWDDVIFIGDAVIAGPQPNEVLNILRSMKGLFIEGNHDREVIHVDVNNAEENPHRKWNQWTRKQISNENMEFLKTFKEACEIECQGIKLALFHGCLPSELGHRFWPDSEGHIFDGIATWFEAPYIVSGHTHIQYCVKKSGRTFINPGGLGQPRLGSPAACYAVVENGKLLLKHSNYDYQKTCKAMDKMPLDRDFVEAWKTSYKDGILAPIYKIRDFETLKNMGYL